MTCYTFVWYSIHIFSGTVCFESVLHFRYSFSIIHGNTKPHVGNREDVNYSVMTLCPATRRLYNYMYVINFNIFNHARTFFRIVTWCFGQDNYQVINLTGASTYRQIMLSGVTDLEEVTLLWYYNNPLENRQRPLEVRVGSAFSET